MKLTKQEEVNEASKNYRTNQCRHKGSSSIRDENGFKAGLNYAEQEFSKLFPNGFESWYETFYEVVSEITFWTQDTSPPLKIKNIHNEYGIGGLYELARELTDKFELLHKDREWDGEFFDEIDEFLETELKKE